MIRNNNLQDVFYPGKNPVRFCVNAQDRVMQLIDKTSRQGVTAPPGMAGVLVKTVLSPGMYCLTRWLLGLIFLYSGIVKLLDLKSFAQVIEAFGLLPWELKSLAALMVSSAELIAGAGLIADIRGSLGTVLLMLLSFMAILGYGITMGYDIDCGCFGEHDPVGQAFHGLYSALLRDLAMTGSVAYLYLWRYKASFGPPGPLEFVRQLTKRIKTVS